MGPIPHKQKGSIIGTTIEPLETLTTLSAQGRVDADLSHNALVTLELYVSINHGEQRIVASSTYVLAGVYLGPTLSDKNAASLDVFAGVFLHTESLRVAISSVP